MTKVTSAFSPRALSPWKVEVRSRATGLGYRRGHRRDRLCECGYHPPMPGDERPRAVWTWATVGADSVDRLRAELGVSEMLARALVFRGLEDPAEADTFLNPSEDQLHDPRLLPDFAAACAAILGAKERGELIYVHGDYDVDGVTSTALFTRFLTRIGCRVAPHVPHRLREGYGIHLDAVGWAKEQGAKLFLTCDCGITAHDQIRAVREAGMVAVVTDHHGLAETLPDAAAVVNPHRQDSQYPFVELSGVGVVFKLCAGITQELGLDVSKFYRAYLDLAVLGTVADVMPLVGENRVITALGLPLLQQTRKAGLRALIEVSKLSDAQKFTSRDIGFRLGPRINAVGRIDDPTVALDLLLTDDVEQARTHAEFLDKVNTERREHQAKAVEQATAQVLSRGSEKDNVIFVWAEDWHPGIVGIVAGKLVEKFGRPSFVASVNAEGVARASARSIAGFDLGEALKAHKHLILGGGGHELAAGLSAPAADLEKLAKSLHDYAGAILPSDAFVPRVSVDVEAGLDSVSFSGLRELEKLEPFGAANREPVLGVRGVTLQDVTPTSNPDHVRMRLWDGKSSTQVMGFGKGAELQAYARGDVVDVAVRLSEGSYLGRPQLTVALEAIRPCVAVVAAQ